MTVLTTARLRLEPLTDAHLPGLSALNSDPDVMRYIGAGRPETLDETRAMIERVKQRWVDTGFSWWALIERDTGELVGAGALQHLRREGAPEPDPTCPLELGWRLRRDRWGRGLASEAGRAIGDFAFGHLGATELLAVCDPANAASASVMRRIGMVERGIERWYGKDLLTYRAGAQGAGGLGWRGLATVRHVRRPAWRCPSSGMERRLASMSSKRPDAFSANHRGHRHRLHPVARRKPQRHQAFPRPPTIAP